MLQNVPDAALEMEGLKVSSLPLESHSAKFDLILSVRESAQGFQADWELRRSVRRRHCKAHGTALQASARSRRDRSRSTYSDLPVLTEPEKHQLLVEWNEPKRDYPKDKCLHQLFEEQVERTPDAIALVFDDQHLTYRELNSRANQLAHYLKKLGVGPNSLVGLCIERSIEMIVGLLGCFLKAGGAYVPLDPNTPKNGWGSCWRTRTPVLLTDERVLQELVENRGLKIDDRDLRSSILDPAD